MERFPWIAAASLALGCAASGANDAAKRRALFYRECAPVGAIVEQAMALRIREVPLDAATATISAKYPAPRYNAAAWVESVYSVPLEAPLVIGARARDNCVTLSEKQSVSPWQPFRQSGD